MQKIILLDRKEKKVKQEAASWLSKLGKDLGKVRKPKSLRHILESTLLILDEAYKQLVAVEGGLKKVPGIGDKTVPAIHSSYNSFRNAIRRVIREMARKDMFVDEGTEKIGELFDQETRMAQELIDALSGFPSPEEVPPDEQQKAKSALPQLLNKMKQLTTITEAIKREYKAGAKVRLYGKKFAEVEKIAQIKSEVNELGRAIDNVGTEMDKLDNAIQELPSDTDEKKEEVREIIGYYDKIGRAYATMEKEFMQLDRFV